MKGFPKHLNTPADVELCRNAFPAQTEELLAQAADNQYTWEVDKQLGIKDVVTEKEDLRVVDVDGVRLQLKRVKDPRSMLVRLGVTPLDSEVTK